MKNVTPKTLTWYHSSWQAGGAFLPDEPKQINPEHLKTVVMGMRQHGLSAISINTHLCGLNAFLRWLHTEGHCERLWKVPKLTVEKKIPQTFSLQQIRQILDYRPKKMNDVRAWLLANLILDTGLRISECLGLRREHVDFDNRLLKVFGKGRKERLVPMSIELRKILYRHMREHNSEWVFGTRQGTVLTERNSQRDLKVLCRKLRITGVRCSPHTLRHTFAVNYIRNGGDVFRLQRILGHTTLEMTRRYVNLQTEDLQAVHDRLTLLKK